MLSALQVKLLAAILAVLVIIAGLIAKGGRPVAVPSPSSGPVLAPEPVGGRPIEITPADRAYERKLQRKLMPK